MCSRFNQELWFITPLFWNESDLRDWSHYFLGAKYGWDLSGTQPLVALWFVCPIQLQLHQNRRVKKRKRRMKSGVGGKKKKRRGNELGILILSLSQSLLFWSLSILLSHSLALIFFSHFNTCCQSHCLSHVLSPPPLTSPHTLSSCLALVWTPGNTHGFFHCFTCFYIFDPHHLSYP